MKKKVLLGILLTAAMFTGCGNSNTSVNSEFTTEKNNISSITANQITELEKGFSSSNFSGDGGFEEFLSQGGASSDKDVVEFLSTKISADISVADGFFGCSTILGESKSGEWIFGRNFDWYKCNALVIVSKPENAYSSISTVNTDFIKMAGSFPDEYLTIAGLYSPLDGMNEKGLAVSVNMIEDSVSIEQNTEKPDITTTTAVRLLLNKAANVDEAIELLEQYDMHSSMGMMIHFALADSTGRSVAAEYINNELVLTDTPILTNFYVADGEKYGIGSSNSHERFEILENLISENNTMENSDIRDALDSVSKHNFKVSETTEWSVVYNLSNRTAEYYHRENFEKKYDFTLN